MIFYILFLSSIDFILGRFFLRANPPVSSVPYASWDVKIENDITHLYDVKNKKVLYIRDENGYRNFRKNKDLILTIGGSTTDQRYTSEEYTWQFLINNKIKDKNIAIINGGVPGQSSSGHLYSINHWHSKSLDVNKVKKVIFYIGANDFHLFNKDVFGYQIRLFLANYSFLYSKLRDIRYLYINNVLNKNANNIYFGEKRNFEFLQKGNLYNVNVELKNQSRIYRNLFKKLMLSTKKKFPHAEIYLVQQHLPGCFFHSKDIVENRYPIIYKNDYMLKPDKTLYSCIMLGKVFIEQDKALDELSEKFKPNVIKMYLDNPLNDVGVYDDLHTNNLGSKQIADYLLQKINF